jgi:hypothetical protein
MNEEELKRLIEKYYNGTSTDEEEKALRLWFSINKAPAGYEAEKAIFGFYMEEEEVPEPSADFEARIIRALDRSSDTARSAMIRKAVIPILSAAAGLLILAGSYFFFINRAEPVDTFKDPAIAYAETVKILKDVSSRMNRGTRPLKPVGKINEMRVKSLGSINKTAVLVEKNLKSLGYLMNSTGVDTASEQKK